MQRIKKTRRLSVGLLVAASALTAASPVFAQPERDAPQRQSIARAADAPLPLSPEESRRHFQLPEGFEIELVASEPLIADPSAIVFDEFGRLFVSELHGYNLEGHLDIEELNKTGQLDRQIRRVRLEGEVFEQAKQQRYGTIKQLIDTDGDGRMDDVRVWADHLPPCYGMVPYRGGLIVVCGPDIVFLADNDGDGHAEVRKVLLTGFDVELMERAINNPRWGLDHWIYVAAGGGATKVTGPKLTMPVQLGRSDFRFKPDGSAVEPVAGANGTFGLALTDYGDRFLLGTSTHALYAVPLPYRYLRRNPFVPAPAGNANAADYHRVYPSSQPHPWRLARGQDPAWVKFYGQREATPNGNFTSACGQMIYRSDLLPAEYYGNHFCCEPSQNLVHRCLLERDGAGYRVRRAPGEEQSEFLSSTDRWHRPINLHTGPDGAIYIVDMYREIIEDYSAIPRHLQQQYGLIEGHDRGRIWRLAPSEGKRRPVGDLAAATIEELVTLLGDHNAWWRETAQRLLIERKDPAATGLLRELVHRVSSPQARLHALYTLDGLGDLRSEEVQLGLGDQNYGVRMHALRLAEQWLNTDEALLGRLLALVDDDDPSVRLQLALTLGESSDPRALNALAELAARHGEERWMAAAILSSCSETSSTLISRLLEIGKPSAGARSILQPLASSVGARRADSAIGKLLAMIAAYEDVSSTEVQLALLNGLIDGLERGKQVALDVGEAEPALQRLLTSSAVELYPPALRVAHLLQLDQAPLMQYLWTTARETALQETASLAKRNASVEILAASPWVYRKSLAKLLDVRQPLELQLSAVKALSAADQAEVPKLLLANWKSLSPQIQSTVIDAFFARLERRPALLDAIESGEVSAAHLNNLRRVQLLESNDEKIRRRAQALMARSTSEARAKILEEFQSALSLSGNLQQGRLVFEKQCSKCHRLEGKGFSVGPELTGATGRPNATLLVDILDPSRNVDPDFTVYTVITNAGRVNTGVLTAETATSVTLRREEGAEDIILRKDIEELTASSQSLMPDAMEKILTPQDLANLFVYLQEVLGQKKAAALLLFDEQQDFADLLDRGRGKVEIVASDRYSGDVALRVEPLQRYSPRIANWSFSIAEEPEPGEFRYLRFAWKSEAARGIMLELADSGSWPPADMALRRYYCGENTTPWQAKQIALRAPKEWTVVTVDLWKDFGSFTLTGIAPTAMGGAALFDRIELLPSLDTAE